MRTQTSSNVTQLPIDVEKMLSGIRIARVSTVPFFVVTQLKHQIAVIGQHGAEVSVVTSQGPELVLLDGLVGVKCSPINIPRSISLLTDILALIRLFILFKHQHIQISHSTTPKAGLLTALAAFLAGTPVRLHTFTGQPWIGMRGPKRWLARICDRLIGTLNTRCYADSESQKEFLIKQGIVDAKRLFVIGAGSLAGVDVQRFDRNLFPQPKRDSIRQSLGIPYDAPILLFVGRITVDKGVRELIQSFQKLRDFGIYVHLILVGPFDIGSGVSGSILSSHIENVQDMHIVGYTDNPESYLSIADILCLPSYREGFGTVVIEAAAMSVPTVGTDIYGLSDAVVHGQTGLLVPPRNVEELTAALQKLLVDVSMRKRMGEAARERAFALFDAKKVNKQVVDEYRFLLENSRLIN